MPSSNPNLRVVVTESEKLIIEAKAKQAGKSVSSFLKDLALAYEINPQGSQPDTMVSQLEQMVLSVQQQITSINEQLANSMANGLAIKEPRVISEEVSQPNAQVSQLEDVSTHDELPVESVTAPKLLTRSELANRLAKTPKEAQSLAATLTNLGGKAMKMDKIAQWTAEKDPDGLSWLPTDETRECWQCQPVS